MQDILKEKLRINLKSKYWRLNNLYRIINKGGNKVKFKFNQEQQKIWDKCFNARGELVRNPNILKARQLGITTFFVINYLDDALFNKNLNVYIQSHDRESIEKIFRIVRIAYDELFIKIRPELDRGGGSKFALYFPELNSRIYVGLENRSSTIHRLHLSEVAFQKKDRITATLGALPPDVKYSSETTPNGMNWYYNDWNDEDQRRANIFFSWFDHDDYILNIDTGLITKEEEEFQENLGIKLTKQQLEFRRAKIRDLKGFDGFNQEYPSDPDTCFISSGKHYFDIYKIRQLSEEINKPIRQTTSGWNIIKERINNHYYIISCDTSEGTDRGDYSTAKIYDSDNSEEVAYFRGRPSYSEFPNILIEGAELYSCEGFRVPLIAVERNNHGHAVLLKLNEMHKYRNIYKYNGEKLGWQTDSITRPKMLDVLKEVIENETLKINDPQFFKECFTFIEENNKFQAESGCHDDSIIAAAIGAYLLSTSRNKIKLRDINKLDIDKNEKVRYTLKDLSKF